MRELLRRIRKLLKDKRFRRLWYRGISTVAAIVVFFTTYALVLPAITMESEAHCGIPAHQHTSDCYEEELICGQEESDGHHHSDECYTVTKELTCTTPEHQHDESCFDEDGNLTCTQTEHTHDDTCYEEHRELTCTLKESEGHHHDSSCYKQVLTCGLEAHIHSTECYKEDSSAVMATDSAAVIAASTNAAAFTESANIQTADDFDGTISVNSATAASASVPVETYDSENVSEASGADNTTNTDLEDKQTDIFSKADTTNEFSENDSPAKSSSTAATTDVLLEPVEQETLSEGYVPTLDPVNMDQALDKHTGFYYYHTGEGEEPPVSSADITSWKKVDDNTELAPTDLVKAYFAYTFPAGTLNETNQVARYRLPSNLHLTDDQIIAINQQENGIAAAYIDYDTLEILDTDNYHKYLGAEAIEGTRTPDQTLTEGAQEYISAVVKAEKVYDDEGIYGEKGAYLGQDLIFVFTPYTIEKNQNTYDAKGNPTAAGEKVSGWFACDFNLEQIDWVEEETSVSEATTDFEATIESDVETDVEGAADFDNTGSITIKKTAEVIFTAENLSENVKEISTVLTMIEESEEETSVDNSSGAATEASTEDAAADNTDIDAAMDDHTEATEDSSTDEVSMEGTDTVDIPTDGSADAESTTADEAPECTSGTLRAIGSDYTIILDYPAEAEIPADAQLKVREITAESDPAAYEACLEQAKAQVAAADDEKTTVDTAASRFFDIEIVAHVKTSAEKAEAGDTHSEDISEGVLFEEMAKIEPKAPVTVNIQISNKDEVIRKASAASSDDTTASGEATSLTDSETAAASTTTETAPQDAPTVLHFADQGVETIESTISDGFRESGARSHAGSYHTETSKDIQFEADSFSIYGVVYTTLATTYITASGETYEITVTYDADAGIPDGSELKVREIEATEDEEEYNDYLNSAASEIGVDDLSKITLARFFDVEIIKKNEDGTTEKIEPAVPVQVSIKHKESLAIDVGNTIQVVHFADKGTEVIKKISLSEDKTEITYEQDSFSVIGEVITGTPTQGTEKHPQQYALVVKYDGTFYSIDSDGTLTPVGVDDEDNPTTVTLGSAMLWSYDQKGTIYHHSDATDTDAGAIAADFYYKYLDVNQEFGIFEEEKIDIDGNPADHLQYTDYMGMPHYDHSVHSLGDTISNDDVVLYVATTNHIVMGEKYAWKVQTHKKDNVCRVVYDSTNHILKSANGDYVLDVGRDSNNVLRIIRKPASDSGAGVPVYFTDVSASVPGVDPYKHTVSHIDISIEGSADIQVPLAYGTYYDSSGPDRQPVLKIEDGVYYEWKNGQWEIIDGMDDAHPITVHKEFNDDNEITGEDIKSATITATDINGKTLPDDFGAYYITGYSMNDPENGEPEQVRIEGSFKVCTLPEINRTEHNNTPNDAETCARRLATAIKYKVTLVKHNQELAVAWNGIQLFNGHGDEMKLTTDITLSSVPFTYWDLENKCPPLWNNGSPATWHNVLGQEVRWQNGAIYTGSRDYYVDENDSGYWLSGIDYRLSGDQVTARAEIPGLEVTKYILDDTGRQIELDPETYGEHPLTSVIHVYEKASPNYESDDVLKLNGGDATRATGQLPADGQYTDPTEDPAHADLYGGGYSAITNYDFAIEIGNNGKGLDHNYRVTDGMYYIVEDKDSVAETVVGADGTIYHYTQTHIETEYAWRDDEYTATQWGGEYNEPVHVSPTYTDLSADGPEYRSIPEVLGNYKDQYGSWVQEDGSSIRNTMLPFYVYNVYTPDVKLDVEKQWAGYEAPSDAEVTVELFYAMHIVKNADGTVPDPIPDWPEKEQYKKVDGATWDGTDHTGGEKNIFADTIPTVLTLKADDDPDKNWKGSFRNIPHRLTDEDGNVWEIDYFAKETAVTSGGEDIMEEFDVAERKIEPTEDEAHTSDGKVTIINGKGSLQLIKKWLLPDGETEYTPSDTEAQITAQLRRKKTVEGSSEEVTEKLVNVTIEARNTYQNNPYNNGQAVTLWKGKVVEGSDLLFSVAVNGTSNPASTINPTGGYESNNECVVEGPLDGMSPSITYLKPMSTENTGINKNANVFALRDAREGTVITANFAGKLNSSNNTVSNSVRNDNTDVAGFGYYIFEMDDQPETETITVDPVNLDEPVTIDGLSTDGAIVLNQTNGWSFKLSSVDMEPGWEYYIVESSIQESNVPSDQYTYVAPVKEVDEDGNVVYTAKNISKGVTLDVNKTWGATGNQQAPPNAEVVVKLQYRTRLKTDTDGEWSEWALVEEHQGADGPFASDLVTSVSLKADADTSKNWKGSFEKLPSTVIIDEKAYDVQYIAVETAVTVDGRDVTSQYMSTVNKTDPVNAAVSAGTVNIRNEKEKVQVTVKKVWDPDPSDPDASVTVQLHRYAKKTKGTIKVTLTDQNGAGIPGAVFTLYKDGTATDTTATTNVNGVISITGLEPGSYYWEQTTVPEGYVLPTGVTGPQKTDSFTVNDNTTVRQEYSFSMTNIRQKTEGMVTLTVIDSDDAPIAGATFTLYKNGTALDDKTGLQTNDRGEIVVDDLGPGEYYFLQTDTPDDYYLPENRKTDTFTVLDDRPGEEQSFTVSMTNKLKGKGWVEITLTKTADDSPISGAIFELLLDGNKLMDGITGSDGKLTFGETSKLDAGTYTVKQVTSGSECIPAEDQSFTILDNEDGNQKKTLEFKNLYQSLGTATITLKREDTNAAIAGAAFELYRNGVLIDTQTTDANGRLVFGESNKLTAGSYTVRQTNTSQGLSTAADQTFTIADNNDPDQNVSLTFTNGEASGNVTIRLYRKGGIGQWNWDFIREYEGLNINTAYTFTANIQPGMYPDRIWYCVLEGEIQNSTRTSNEQKLDANGYNASTGLYTFNFTPTKQDMIYNLVLIADNWGYEGITNYQMVTTRRTSSVRTMSRAMALTAAGAPGLSAANEQSADNTEDTANEQNEENTGSSKAEESSENTVGTKTVKSSRSLTSAAVTDAQPVKVPADLADEYMEDSTFTVQEYVITASDTDWSHTFPAEDKYDDDGNLYYYYVVETAHTPSSYVIESYAGDPLSSNGTITITNTQKPGGLTITKAVTVNGGTVPEDAGTIADGTYTFTITGPDSYTYEGSITVTNGVASSSIVLENLIAGSYTITETGSTNPNGITLDAPKTITVAAGSQASENVAAFTNNLVTAELVIHKVDADGMTTPLPGAKFEIRRIDGTATTISYIDTATDPTTAGTDNKTGADGIATFENLVTGYYEVWERELPAGYILEEGDGKFYIKVDAGAVTLINKTDNTAPVNWPGRSDEAKLTFNAASKTATVGNTPGVELPSTGGSGTRLIYILGGMLTLASGLLLLLGRNRFKL